MPLEAQNKSESRPEENESPSDMEEKKSGWENHPVDIRFSLPLPGRRIFLTLVAGFEKRGWQRRREDLLRHPVGKRNNIVLFLGLALALYLVGAALVVLNPLLW